MACYISGVGFTKVGRHYNKGLPDLFYEASIEALEESGNYGIDAIVVANSFASRIQMQNMVSVLLAEEIGVSGVQTFTIENGGASGTSALHVARALALSGMAKRVLVVGIEKASDLTSASYNSILSQLINADYEAMQGASLASHFALVARDYLRRYNIGEELLAEWPVFMHENSLNAHHPQFRFKITVEQVMTSDYIAPPLRVLHSHQQGDGAAALVLSLGENEKEARLARVVATSITSHRMELALRDVTSAFHSVEMLTERLLGKVKLDIASIDIIDVLDKYSIAGPIILEALGAEEPGRSLHAIRDGRFRLGDRPTVNVAGGVKARGHPTGATGLYQVVEVVSSFHGIHSVKQVENANYGLVVSIGGVASTSSGAVLERV
uniref:Thiolase family protein n=1 Tax=Fervidicoccus fontis TaxID=683846 RepID=A0A7J3ZKG4_9CREN